MASAERKTKTETVMVPQEKVVEDGLILHLSPEEVRTLRVILLKVAGSPHRSPRKHAEAISDAIDRGMRKDKWNWEDWCGPELYAMQNLGNGIGGVTVNDDPKENDK